MNIEVEKIKSIIREVVKEEVGYSHLAVSKTVSDFGDMILKSKKDQTFFDNVVKYWPLILGIVFIIASWVKLDIEDNHLLKKVEVVEGKTLAIEDSIEQTKLDQNKLLIELSSIRTDVGWIKSRIK